ncbi:MAG: MarR family winged helix-turn-helix transcriptional regulator [Christensenellales bacterium]
MPAISRDLNVLARCGNQFRSMHLDKLGLTAFQAPYIQHVCASPGLSQEQLALALHVNRSSAARQLKLLEDKGFIQRLEDKQDKRLLLILPTDKARDALPTIRQVNEAWNDYLTQGMTPAEQGQLAALLERLRARAIAWVPEEEDL